MGSCYIAQIGLKLLDSGSSSASAYRVARTTVCHCRVSMEKSREKWQMVGIPAAGDSMNAQRLRDTRKQVCRGPWVGRMVSA